MFCQKCGKQIADGAKFCSVCGTPVPGAAQTNNVPQGQPVMQQPYQQYVPVKPAEPNPMFANFFAAIKSFCSKNAGKTVDAAAGSKTMEWILFVATAIISFSLSCAVVFSEMFGDNINYVADYNFGIFFLYGLVVSVVALGGMFGGLLLTVNVILKKNVSVHSIFNVVGIASIPITIVSIVNMLLGLIWWLLVPAFLAGALICSVALLYKGFCAMVNSNDCFWSFTLTAASVGIVVAVVAYLLLSKPFVGGYAVLEAEKAIRNAADDLRSYTSRSWF